MSTRGQTRERAQRLRAMTAEYLNSLTPAQRDRLMQTHLAQARGRRLNAELLRGLTHSLVRIVQAKGVQRQNG
jgi:hypothetical protein